MQRVRVAQRDPCARPRRCFPVGAAPVPGAEPARLDFSAGRNFATLSPGLAQIVWIGPRRGGPGVASYGDTLIGTQAIRVLTAATIVVDIDRAAGRTLDAVAGYVALVALAEIRAAAPVPPGSVLGLFAGNDAAQFGDGDAAFLRALYAMPLDRLARQQRARLLQALTAAPDGDRPRIERYSTHC